MQRIKKVLRLIGLVVLILLASFGIGITGTFLPTHRDRYHDTEIRIEQVDQKRDEDEEADKSQE